MSAQACTAHARISRSWGPGAQPARRRRYAPPAGRRRPSTPSTRRTWGTRLSAKIVSASMSPNRRPRPAPGRWPRSGRVVEAAVGVPAMPAASSSARRSAELSRRRDDVERRAVAEEVPSWRSACAKRAMSSWSGVLAEDLRDLVGAHRAQLRFGHGPSGAEAVGETPGDGEVARHRDPVGAAALAQRGEPARAEVDRVEGEDVRRDVGGIAFEVVALGVHLRERPGVERLERVEVDAHRAGVRGDLRARGADLVGKARGHRRPAYGAARG